MSKKALDYSITQAFGSNQRLLAFYDFSGMSGRHIGSKLEGGLDFAVIENCDPAADTGVYSGIVTVGIGSVVEVKDFATGTFLPNDQAHLSEANIKVNTPSVDYSSLSTLVDFDFTGIVNDCILFGSLEKTTNEVNGVDFNTGAKGYNVGITKRGHLFFQGFDKRGQYVNTANSIELGPRNIVSFSVGANSVSLSRYDQLNDTFQSEAFPIDTTFIANNDEFYIGGANEYFRGGANGPSGEFKTASGINLNSFCLFSGKIPNSTMFAISSGLIGEYFTSTTSPVVNKRITGYNQSITYKTGITGYDYENTSSISIATGDYMLTGNFFGATSVNTGEGDRYFIYKNIEKSGVKTFSKEEVGFLHPDSGYQYLPTGDNAFATLGLQNVEGAVSEYVEQRGISGAASVLVKLYASRFMVGTLSGISGVVQEPVFETTTINGVDSSGVRKVGESLKLKKNYIYYLGERIGD